MDDSVLEMSYPVLKAFFAGARPKKYAKSELILGSDQTEKILFISSGFVKGYTLSDEGDRHILVIKGAGDLLAVTNLFTDDTSAIFYEAMTEVAVRSLSKTKYEAAVTADPALAVATLKKLIQDMRDTTRRLLNLNIPNARQRIIYRILFLAKRFGAASVKDHEVLFVPLTYQDLADSLQLARETANRVVRDLMKEGLVVKSHGYVIITSKTKLEAEIAGI